MFRRLCTRRRASTNSVKEVAKLRPMATQRFNLISKIYTLYFFTANNNANALLQLMNSVIRSLFCLKLLTYVVSDLIFDDTVPNRFLFLSENFL